MAKKPSTSVTLKDVASRANVSLATASRVLSNSDYPVKPELRERILSVSEELNYSPNPIARMLKSNTYHAIGIIIPTLQNPFFNQVILGIEAVAYANNYEIIILSSHRSIKQERNNINTMLQNRVMALIIISIDSDSSTIKNYINYGGKVALLESNFQLDDSKAIVTETDYLSAGKIATEYLLKAGHKEIAFLTSPLTKSYRRQILVGIQRTMKENNIPFSEENIIIASSEDESDTGLYEFELGKQLVDLFLQNKKQHSAIIAINDITAFGVIQALTLHGISVPKDISVVSFDNIIYSEMISPPLTTVELPSSGMGYTACKMLISTLTDTAHFPDGVFRFRAKLIERGSVLPRKE